MNNSRDLMPFYLAPEKRKPANYWNVSSSGHYGLDIATGSGFAESFMTASANDDMYLLADIVRAMITNYGGAVPDGEHGYGLMLGFFEHIEKTLIRNRGMIQALANHGLRFTPQTQAD